MLTDAQIANVRRFAGYQLAGTTQPITADQDIVYMAFGMVTMSLYKRLTNLRAEEEAILVAKYLEPLDLLEDAIVSASDNLDTASAAVWTHNKNEVRDRTNLFNQKRRDMCEFLGIKPGKQLGDGVARIVRG